MMITSGARQLQAERVYRVVTATNGKQKVQRWNVNHQLILPEPMNAVMKVKDGKIYFGERKPGVLLHDTALEVLGEVSLLDNFKLDHDQCTITVERVNWADGVQEYKNENKVDQCLYYLLIQGFDGSRSTAKHFRGLIDLEVEHSVVASAKGTGSLVEVRCKSEGLRAVIARPDQKPEDWLVEYLEPGKSYEFPNSQLRDLKIVRGHDWWQFRPIVRAFDILQDTQDTRMFRIVGIILGTFLTFTLGNYFFRAYQGLPENELAKLDPPVGAETLPAQIELPKKFVEERVARINQSAQEVAPPPPKDRVVEMKEADEKKAIQAPAAQAILGDGKLPPGGQKDGPVSPAPAKGNGYAPALNGGALGTLKGKLSDAAPLPKTTKVHAGRGLPKDALLTKQKISPMGMTDKAVKSTNVIALEQDQAKKLLAKKAADLRSAFGSVLGYLNEKQAPDDLAMTDSNAKSDQRRPKKGGLLVAPGGTGKGITEDDRVLVLGQVGSTAGSGIVGGTGGAPNGRTGGYGLSTKYKGTGTDEGTGIGGSKGGNVFVDFDAINNTGEFGGSVSEGLTRNEVGKVIHAHSAELRECYQSHLMRTPGEKGRLMIDFTINPTGKVSKSSIRESDFKSDFLASCVRSRLGTWAFPKPRNNVSVQVGYPFSFKSLGGGR